MKKSVAIRVLILAILLTTAADMWADTLVTACVSDTQSGSGVNLAKALALGGTIRFACPVGTIIHVTSGYTIPTGTVIDGDDKVTLDGLGMNPGPLGYPALFWVRPGKITLRRITLRHFYSVLQAEDAELDHARVEAAESGILVTRNLTIVDSSFQGNRTVAVWHSGGAARIERTAFIGNETAVLIHRGSIVDSTFIGNTRGAIYVLFPTERVEIRGSTFQGNTGTSAIRLSQRSSPEGKAIVVIRGNYFTENDGGNDAGAISVSDGSFWHLVGTGKDVSAFPPARFELAYDRFTRNQGANGGAIGADLHNSAGMTVVGGLFTENSTAGDGGAIAWAGGALTITHSLFRANHAGASGAAVYGGMGDGATLVIGNSLIVENVGPGGVLDADTAMVANVTIANNDATGLVLRDAKPFASVANTILSQNRPSNCGGIAPQSFHGGNLQFGTSDCPGVGFGDPYLDTHYVPAFGSAVLELGDVAICRAAPVLGVDIVFQGRPNPARCSLGAFERPPVRLLRMPKEHIQ